MGDNFLKQQVRNFKKGRDKALGKLAEPTLFTMPDEMGKTYRASRSTVRRLRPRRVICRSPYFIYPKELVR